MSSRALRGLLLVGLVLITAFAAFGVAAGDARQFRARPLIGFEESPPVSTVARGAFSATLSRDGTTVSYELRFSSLEGTVTQSHIHFAQRGVSAGITVWLCETGTNPAPTATTPACPTGAAGDDTVTGSFTAADVIGPAGQGIAPAEFGELIRAMRAGMTYVNVHSSKFPGGEIRAQIRADD
ncbi:MAG TPA: CHRD domain-containing protein [Candidatus Limnocylindrales bacterium]|jgi:hypothetical protein